MVRYLIRRILWACLLFVIITFVTFVIFFMGPNDPALGGCPGSARLPEAAHGEVRPRQAAVRAVLVLLRPPRDPPEPRHVVRDGPERQSGDRQGSAGDGVARLRARHPLDYPGADHRRLLGVTAALGGRAGGDDIRADRDLGPSALD